MLDDFNEIPNEQEAFYGGMALIAYMMCAFIVAFVAGLGWLIYKAVS